MSTFGERLKEERMRLDLSQTTLGEACGVTKQSQINYEKNERAPDALYLAALATAGADVLYILTGSRAAPPGPPLAPDEAALLDNYRHSPPEGQTALKTTSAALAQCPAKARKRAA